MAPSKLVYAFTVCLIVCGVGCSHEPKDIPDVCGQQVEKVTARYGPPQDSVQFVIADSLMLEYRRGLYNFYSTDYTKAHPVEILELHWLSSNVHRVVWFDRKGDRWSALEGVEWNPKYIQF